ncbi:hypothetical protein CB1_000813019 [Camelus ferus]|nr:hypothetical protein CB1_000813019 [Camelus ferus]
MHNTVGGAMAGPGAHQLGSTRMPNHDTSVVIQQAMPSPQSSSVITQAPSTNRQIGCLAQKGCSLECPSGIPQGILEGRKPDRKWGEWSSHGPLAADPALFLWRTRVTFSVSSTLRGRGLRCLELPRQYLITEEEYLVIGASG